MTTIKLSDKLVEDAKRHAVVFSRSVPKQIEYWSRIGRLAEENPDLPYSFIQEVLLGLEDDEVTPFEFSTGKRKKK